MEISTPKLKLCPFCGGTARILRLKGGSYCAACSGCGARSRSFYVQPWHDNKSVAQCQAAKLWNTRTD